MNKFANLKVVIEECLIRYDSITGEKRYSPPDIWIKDESGSAVALMAGNHLHSPEELKKRAYVFSAAPEMLEKIKRIVAHSQHDSTRIPVEFVDELRLIIVKAEDQ